MFIAYKNITIAIVFCAFVLQSNFAQNGSANFCINAEPLCGSTQFTYPNAFNLTFAEAGPHYGCLFVRLNPSWFYLQTDTAGDIELKIEQSSTPGGLPDIDVDFIIYGPFSDPRTPCVADLTQANTVDCAYSNSPIEFVNINNTQAGAYYLLLITNFSFDSGFVTVTQTAGAATTNCVIVEEPTLINEFACMGETISMDATTANAFSYVWFEETNPDSGSYVLITNQNTSTYNSSSAKNYRAEALDANNVVIAKYEFHLNFAQQPKVPTTIQDYLECDTLGENDGITTFDLSYMDSQILGGLNPSNFVVTYYKTEEDANIGNNALPKMYTNDLIRESIYVRLENVFNTEVTCFDVGRFNIEVNLLPEMYLEDHYILCINTNGTEELVTPPLMDTGLISANYSFVWRFDGVVLPNETAAVIAATQDGTYSVEATHISTNCKNTATTTVSLSSPPEVNVEIVSYAFTEKNMLEVRATGIGEQDYEYQIDGGPWQTAPIFKDVNIGEHDITVRNIIGCGRTTISKMVMDYPLYFTPNGDGVHDTWNIVGINNMPQATVYLFDRYGKLLKQLNPTTKGWDGTINGALMPTNDYWFTVEFIEPKDGSNKIFKSHFTLKR